MIERQRAKLEYVVFAAAAFPVFFFLVYSLSVNAGWPFPCPLGRETREGRGGKMTAAGVANVITFFGSAAERNNQITD